jgi:hypothetical protein
MGGRDHDQWNGQAMKPFDPIPTLAMELHHLCE